jgi:hypothetical protein
MAREAVTLDRVMEALGEFGNGEQVGFCLGCGAEASGVEPDAREYECEECGQSKVYGVEELLFMLA